MRRITNDVWRKLVKRSYEKRGQRIVQHFGKPNGRHRRKRESSGNGIEIVILILDATMLALFVVICGFLLKLWGWKE
jgi:hypothetical protein